MILTAKPRYLLDANVLIARVFEVHTHHRTASTWFNTPGLRWALCPFTEAAFLRYATSPIMGNLDMGEATALLESLSQHPGYQFQPLTQNWRDLTKPFFRRLHGHKQVMDAYLLGQALLENFVVATFDSAFLHLAGTHSTHVRILGATESQ